MINQEFLIGEVASFKKEAKKDFDWSVASLLSLAWPYRKEGFAFNADFPLYDESLVVCIELSDRCQQKARKHLLRVVESIEWDGNVEDLEDEDELERFDMSGTHLLDLLGLWVSVAAINEWTQSYTRVMISRYLANPFLCPQWNGIPLDALAWGRGYAKDIAEQLALIGQGIIISGARQAEQEKELENGATFYIRHRGSNYDCPECDDMAEKPIPIDIPFQIPHPRCVCWPEYIHEPLD